MEFPFRNSWGNSVPSSQLPSSSSASHSSDKQISRCYNSSDRTIIFFGVGKRKKHGFFRVFLLSLKKSSGKKLKLYKLKKGLQKDWKTSNNHDLQLHLQLGCAQTKQMSSNWKRSKIKNILPHPMPTLPSLRCLESKLGEWVTCELFRPWPPETFRRNYR